METLNFEAEPFDFEEAPATGCGCAQCRQQELDDNEWEWETNPRKKCSEGTPTEVEECDSEPEVKAVQCLPSANKRCPALPETWKSKTIAGVPFYYGPKLGKVATNRFDVTSDGTNRQVNIVPIAWRAAQSWVTSMNTVFGMRISAVYTSGQGRYCRCVRHPKGVCKESDRANWDKCTGTTLSDHGYGDALDIIGVRWVDPKAVGSATATTVIHSWQDANQAALLIRMNAAMRVAFNTVLDYSRADHRDHFHCDMNQGRVRKVFGESPCEPNFIMSSLKRLKYVTSATPVNWARARDALADFATQNKLAVPANRDDKAAWRPVAQRLFACIALGIPNLCAKP